MSRSKFEYLQLYFPMIAEKVVEYRENGPCELVLTLDDGDMLSYDNFDKTIRKLPTDVSNMTEEETRNEFGIRLRQHLFARGMSQLDLSIKTGITQPMLSRYMTGKTSPSFHVVTMIAKAIGCSTDDLYYHE